MLVIMLDALVPVFFGMALGYLGGWTRDVDNKHVAELNALVMDFAVPASMFVTIVQASRRTLLDELPLAANLSISMLILYLVTYVMARRGFGADPGEASIQALTTSLPNYASAGLPLISALLGADHLVAAAVAIACGSIVVSPITLVILDRTSQTQDERSITASLVSAVTKPIVLSPILAVAFVLTGIGLSDPLTRSFTLMGQVAGGAGLFLTGLILSAQKLGLGTNAEHSNTSFERRTSLTCCGSGVALRSTLRSRRARRSCCQRCLSGSSASCSDCASTSRPRLRERR